MTDELSLENICKKLTQKEEEFVLQLITIDPVTQLPNRKGLANLKSAVIGGAMRKGEYFNLLLIDADHFKQYNDTKGHPEGDKLLHGLAQTMRDTLRSGDQNLLHRIGGDEFAIIFPSAKASAGYTVGEKLRKAIEKNYKASHGITISVGVASIRPEKSDDVNNLYDLAYQRADKALYYVKNAGRNGVQAASSKIIREI
jgi:diguanylate cyclase (GGDEF)-like protein